MTPHRKSLVFGILLSLLLPVAVAFAVTPDEMLSDPKLESRARVISQELRCVVCPNQSIDDSNAPLAKDLRVLIRDRLKAGDSNAQAIDFVVERYGNFVLLKPPFQLNTLLLWLAPALLAIIVLFQLMRFLRRQQSLPASEGFDSVEAESRDELSADEAKRLREILEKGPTS